MVVVEKGITPTVPRNDRSATIAHESGLVPNAARVSHGTHGLFSP